MANVSDIRPRNGNFDSKNHGVPSFPKSRALSCLRTRVTPKERVFVFNEAVKIPKRTFNPGTQRMVTSFDISENQFHHIVELGDTGTDRTDELEQEEGQRTLKLHQSIERKPGLVSAFKQGLSSFACTICNFEFEKEYGPIGKAYIECHHTRPVGEMRPGQRTKLSDLVAVCSNCHRMLHRASPMLTAEKLREMRERSR